MRIISDTLSFKELNQMAVERFGNMVKAVVDVDKGILALDADLHSDLEAFLLENGSRQNNLWGINLYPGSKEEEFIEFDSMINLRPTHGNVSRGVDEDETRRKISEIVFQRIIR